MKAAQLDDRRRVVMPPECPAGSTVTIDRLDQDTWLLRRHKRDHGLKLIAVQSVRNLPADPDREKIEAQLARHASGKLSEPA
jgi:hypothetical protein